MAALNTRRDTCRGKAAITENRQEPAEHSFPTVQAEHRRTSVSLSKFFTDCSVLAIPMGRRSDS